jgi:hypothetical protein
MRAIFGLQWAAADPADAQHPFCSDTPQYVILHACSGLLQIQPTQQQQQQVLCC